MTDYLIFDVDTLGNKDSKLGLNSRKTRITLIGVKTDQFEKIITSENEKEILQEFWRMVRVTDYKLVGWNIDKFDIPFLYVRSLVLGVAAVNLQNRTIDLRTILGNGDKYAKGKLTEYTDLIGYKTRNSGFNKSGVCLLWEGHEIPELMDRLFEDVRRTYKLFKRMEKVKLIQ